MTPSRSAVAALPERLSPRDWKKLALGAVAGIAVHSLLTLAGNALFFHSRLAVIENELQHQARALDELRDAVAELERRRVAADG